MTRLRSQLRSARQAYRSARYPGDLSSELFPTSSRRTGPSRRWLLLTGVAGSAAAAAVMLSVLMARVTDLPRPWPTDGAQRALVDWLPIAPEKFPVPKFQAPTLPDLHYRDLALPYPKLQPALPNLDLRRLPELPARSVEWLRDAWDAIESA